MNEQSCPEPAEWACPEPAEWALQTHPIVKRKPGGQKGNQNARKHGFYSGALSPSQICAFWNIVNQEGLEPEVAVLRIKLQSLLRPDGINRRVLKEASKLFATWYRTKWQLDSADNSRLKKLIWNILESHLESLRGPYPKPGKNI